MKIALYQEYPGRTVNKYGIFDVGVTNRSINLFPVSVAGLQKAIDTAERSDAQVVKIEKDYYTSEELLAEVTKLIKQKRGKRLFMPALGIEREFTK